MHADSTAGASGDYAVAIASGTVTRPDAIYVKVIAQPRQTVSVAWALVCSRHYGAGSKNGSYHTASRAKRKLRLPMRHPDDCTVSATAQLETSGRIRVQILAT